VNNAATVAIESRNLIEKPPGIRIASANALISGC
jgi:hypothetical protein